ncbi:MAG: Ig-like domain-containing protein [Chthoniobacteraceae bacterium]
MLPRIASLVALFVVSHAQAVTYRVGPTRGYKTLDSVSSRLRGGDIVEVDGGATYVGQSTLRNSGSITNPITIRGIDSGTGRPVLSTSGGIAGGSVVRFWGHHTVFENFEVTANRDAATGRGLHIVAHNVTIRSCTVHDVKGQGIHGSDSAGSITLDRVEVYRCGAGDREHQIYVASDNEYFGGAVFRMGGCYVHDGLGGNNVKSRAGRSEIFGNWIEGAAFHELDLIGADPSSQLPGTAHWLREDADVVGNVLRKRAGSAGYFARLGTDGTGASNARYRFFHNTFVVDPAYRATATVFGMKGAVQSIEAFNNVFHNPVTAMRVYYGGPSHSSGANNWVTAKATAVPAAWTSTIAGTDPGFRDAAALDFTPRADGPLFGAGVTTTTSPAGYEFPNPLASPAIQPPTPAAPATPRAANGLPDIGAFDLPDPAPGQANTVPQAVDDLVDFTGSTAVTIAVLANDSDADGDALLVTSVTRPRFGTASIVGGAILYTPRTTFPGEEVLTYRVCDGRAVCAATLTLRNPFVVVRGSFDGLVLAGDVADGFAGALQISLGAFGTFTGTLRLGPVSHALRGIFDVAGDGRVSITRKNLPPLEVVLHIDFAESTLAATVSDGTRTASVSSDRVIYDKAHPLAHAGNYTALLPDPASRSFPPGNGFAVLSVSATGGTRIVGVLGDGVGFSVGGWVHKDGSLPVFAPLYPKVRGALSGSFSFSPEGATGSFAWWKPPQPSGVHRDGFRIDLDAVGTRWKRSAWLGGSATLTFAGGELAAPASASVVLSPVAPTMFPDAGGIMLSFDVKAASGTFKGRIQHPVLNRAVDVRGAVLQPLALGAGFFTGSASASSVDLAFAP